jgi:hypothetical protein
LQLKVGDHAYLRVSPTKCVQRSRVRGKLAPRYVGPYEITEICGSVAYRMRLRPPLVAFHDIFHVSPLKKCIQVPTKIVEQQEIWVETDLSYRECPVKILDTKERVTR